MTNNYDLKTIISAFQIEGDFVSGAPYGSGHINDTYCIIVNQAGTQVRYILQRINHSLFTDVPGLMQNIERVCAHAQNSLKQAGVKDASRRALTVVPANDGASYLKHADGTYWRVYLFIENATGYDVIETEKQAFEAAKAFGAFQKLLSDLPGARLNETIPDFHNTRKRLEFLEAAIADDCVGRAADCKAEIDWALAHRALADGLLSLFESGLIPERVTHNDTKLNNVLIDDATDEATCVIDLDTVMPGLALYDFGDMVRTSTSPAAEDEQDLGKVRMQLPMFEALVRGYLQGTDGCLNETEVANLPLAGMVITYTIGIRFLADYLKGDIYFKTHRPNHNLERCRTQFRLIESMEDQLSSMERVVKRYCQ